MKKSSSLAFLLLACLVTSSCSNDEVSPQTPTDRDIRTDMQIRSCLADLNESVNEYYINEQKKIRISSYIYSTNQQELQNVSPVYYEKYMATLAELNNNVANPFSARKLLIFCIFA